MPMLGAGGYGGVEREHGVGERVDDGQIARAGMVAGKNAVHECPDRSAGAGMNSPLDIDCTGNGEGNNDSAEESCASSSGDSMLIGSR
jgi:hypothetical protein